ncbi:AP-3 complex subunit sigma-1-like [Vombatus ursinus]|uniref:AP-3 complex subunit sigma-1-like n=1 Tax=Vombatus ursinus TaxID=29139 RepID=UPI000FFD7D3C|nr:AP-3 complex subunit sigma-1-like [Vombatus ursinus]
MIKAMIFIFNNQRKLQLSRFYQLSILMETLDKCFENTCELDLIFHVHKVHNIMAEMVMRVMVLETNMNEIATQIDMQDKLEKSESGLAGAPECAVSIVSNMNLPDITRNNNIGEISIKVPNLPSFK